MRINYKLSSLAILVVLLGFGAGYFSSIEPADVFENPDISLPVDPQCALNEDTCSRMLSPGASVDFSILPRPVPGASPLSFRVAVEGIDVLDAALDLEGEGMNMGRYRIDLNKDALGDYVGAGNLPVCIRSQMQWQADLWLKTRERGLVKVSYQFTAYKS